MASVDQGQSDGTFNVSNLHKICNDGDDREDFTSDMEHDGTYDEEDQVECMARRKRVCMISTKSENEQQHNEAQSQSNGHSTNETNDANSSQMDTTTNEHSDNQNELGGSDIQQLLLNWRWQKKMHFLLTTLKVVYVLTTPLLELLEDATVEAIRRRARMLNRLRSYGILFNPSIWQRLLRVRSSWILGQYTQHGLKMDESYVSSVIDKLPPSWKDFKHTLKHGKDALCLVQLGSHLRIEESLRTQHIDKGKEEVAGPSVNMTKEDVKKKHNKQNKGKKRGSNENNGGSGSNTKPKLECQ
ncbi:hypothetical protein Tco_0737355, partial [Tanacetum coccineum]